MQNNLYGGKIAIFFFLSRSLLVPFIWAISHWFSITLFCRTTKRCCTVQWNIIFFFCFSSIVISVNAFCCKYCKINETNRHRALRECNYLQPSSFTWSQFSSHFLIFRSTLLAALQGAETQINPASNALFRFYDTQYWAIAWITATANGHKMLQCCLFLLNEKDLFCSESKKCCTIRFTEDQISDPFHSTNWNLLIKLIWPAKVSDCHFRFFSFFCFVLQNNSGAKSSAHKS